MAIYLNNHMVGINNTTTVEHNINTTVTVEPLTITANGSVTAPSGKAYSPITINVPPTLRPIQLRPDVELIQTYTRDYKIVADDEITIPAYSTSSKTLLATANLSPTVTLDYNNYTYLITERNLIIPEYNIDTKGTGRIEYLVSGYSAEIFDLPANFFKTMDGTKSYASRYAPISGQGYYAEVYWSSASAIAPYSTSSYGIVPLINAPTISSGKLTMRTPTINIRGHATYFNTTYFSALTDIRIQYVMEVYRVPRNNLNIDAWSGSHNADKIRACIDTNNCKLI